MFTFNQKRVFDNIVSLFEMDLKDPWAIESPTWWDKQVFVPKPSANVDTNPNTRHPTALSKLLEQPRKRAAAARILRSAQISHFRIVLLLSVKIDFAGWLVANILIGESSRLDLVSRLSLTVFASLLYLGSRSNRLLHSLLASMLTAGSRSNYIH